MCAGLRVSLSVLAFFCASTVSVAAEPQVFVSTTGQDSPTCGSQTTPCRSIAFTLRSRATVNGSTVIVQPGVYMGESIGDGNPLMLADGLTIRSADAARAPLLSRGVFLVKAPFAIAFQSVTIESSMLHIWADNITLVKVTLTNNSVPTWIKEEAILYGPGVTRGIMNFTDSSFIANKALPTTSYQWTFLIFQYKSGAFFVNRCVFRDNYFPIVWIGAFWTHADTVVITNTLFMNNTNNIAADAYRDNKIITVDNTSFVRNRGNAPYFSDSKQLSITNSQWLDNVVVDDGGRRIHSPALTIDNCGGVLRNCTFINNRITSPYSATAGIHFAHQYGQTVTIDCSWFEGNKAAYTTWSSSQYSAGAIFDGDNWATSSFRIVNSVFLDNQSPECSDIGFRDAKLQCVITGQQRDYAADSKAWTCAKAAAGCSLSTDGVSARRMFRSTCMGEDEPLAAWRIAIIVVCSIAFALLMLFAAKHRCGCPRKDDSAAAAGTDVPYSKLVGSGATGTAQRA